MLSVFCQVARKGYAAGRKKCPLQVLTPSLWAEKSHPSFSAAALIGFCSSQEGPLEKHSRPLTGKIIVLTRAPAQAQDWHDALEALGAGILRLPTIDFAPPENSDALDSALRRFTEFDWLLFTS